MVIRVPPKYSDFYPRPPRGGRRLRVMSRRGTWLFLSTPSARRATFQRDTQDQNDIHFYPRPPRGGRPGIVCLEQSKITYFYPRPPRGGRRNTSYQRAMADIFLSTPSARRATAGAKPQRSVNYISIHALREEGDLPFDSHTVLLTDFYPRPPRGGRPAVVLEDYEETKFLSTPSARRATRPDAARQHRARFLSTPSARRATQQQQGGKPDTLISIHALREEGDSTAQQAALPTSEFLSTPSARRATLRSLREHLPQRQFLSTPSARRATLL